MKNISIFDVANYFLLKVDVESGSVMTPLKIQKLCYYAQAWYYTYHSKPLFKEKFQAWSHGPANPELYSKYKKYGWCPIDEKVSLDLNSFTQNQLNVLDEVFSDYGIFDGKYLEDLTHQEEPWLMARNGIAPDEHCNNTISLESMKQYYAKFVSQ